MPLPVLILDPGHGGHDPGAVGPTGLRESDVALSICLELRDHLHGACHVVLTRDNDDFLSLSERASFANQFPSGYFLSIHLNAANGRAYGFEAYTTIGPTGADPFATSLLNHYAPGLPNPAGRFDLSDGDPDKERNFAVLRNTSMPAVLFECCFIDNPATEEWLRDALSIPSIADSLAAGILSHLNHAPSPPAPEPAPVPPDLEADPANFSRVYAHLRDALAELDRLTLSS